MLFFSSSLVRCISIIICGKQSSTTNQTETESIKIHTYDGYTHTTHVQRKKRKSYYTYHFIRSEFTISTAATAQIHSGAQLTLNTIFLAQRICILWIVECTRRRRRRRQWRHKRKLRNLRINDENFYSIEFSRRVRFKYDEWCPKHNVKQLNLSISFFWVSIFILFQERVICFYLRFTYNQNTEENRTVI